MEAATPRGVPAFAGTGGPLPTAIRLASLAEQAGCDGLLLLPPYLAEGPPAGPIRYTEAVAQSTRLPIVVYNRGNARYDAESAALVASIRNVEGFKDGIGDIDLMARIKISILKDAALIGKEFQLFNGLPTAEIFAGAYAAIGVPLYSSAIFSCSPNISSAFHKALHLQH